MALRDHLGPGVDPPDTPADRPDFWRFFWERGITPWDLGGAHPEMERRLESLRAAAKPEGSVPLRAFVPGCGRGHDALRLADAGWSVSAVDFAPEAEGCVAAALQALGGRFILGDVFEVDVADAFDLWWEHTFFCALPPTRRADWGRFAAQAIRPGGLLAAVAFPIGKPIEDGGPPFGVEIADYDEALGDAFDREIDDPIESGDGHRSYPERFALWRRRE